MERLRAFIAGRPRAFLFLFLFLTVGAYVAWSFPLERSFVYRYRHGLGAGLKSAAVSFTQGGALVRGAVFMYGRGPDKGPASQDHAVRLAPGRYDAVFVLEYLSGDRKEISLPVVVERLSRDYTLDLRENP
jgi:hypothetical protein